MLTIDGSQGEGGGQVLRSSLALSMVTGTAFRIVNVRARRPKPGLRRQHLTAVEAAVEVSGAEVSGAKLGSLELCFTPRSVRAGHYSFDVGTAGSTTLVLQTVLPALLRAGGASTLRLEGGTHNPLAPPFEFLERTFLPLLARMGPRVRAKLDRHGFYPAGGGLVRVEVAPTERMEPLDLPSRGALKSVRAWAVVSALPRTIAERELKVFQRALSLPKTALEGIEVERPRGPGNCAAIEVQSDEVTEVFAAFGQRGVRAEEVAATAAAEAKAYLDSRAAVGTHLADQLLIPLAMAGGGSFTTLPLTGHTTTNMEVVRTFTGIGFRVTEEGEGSIVKVEVAAS
jgi:RNA 3'-terminal phosphate cyclase (ATP)